MKTITTTRRAYYQKGTLYVAMPKKFTQLHNIQPGDSLIIIAGETMCVVPSQSWRHYGQLLPLDNTHE